MWETIKTQEQCRDEKSEGKQYNTQTKRNRHMGNSVLKAYLCQNENISKS